MNRTFTTPSASHKRGAVVNPKPGSHPRKATESLTLPVIIWLILAPVVGFLVGWWFRGRDMAGRELTLERTFNNRVSAIEEDARRVLERVRADSEVRQQRLEAERDQLRARLSRFDTSGRPPARPDPAPRAAVRTGYPPAPTGSGANRDVPTAPDDLTQIKGIGPAYEERLRALGYRAFRDIARWDASDFEALGEGFGARIRLTEWSARAAELHREKYGEEA